MQILNDKSIVKHSIQFEMQVKYLFTNKIEQEEKVVFDFAELACFTVFGVKRHFFLKTSFVMI